MLEKSGSISDRLDPDTAMVNLFFRLANTIQSGPTSLDSQSISTKILVMSDVLIITNYHDCSCRPPLSSWLTDCKSLKLFNRTWCHTGTPVCWVWFMIHMNTDTDTVGDSIQGKLPFLDGGYLLLIWSSHICRPCRISAGQNRVLQTLADQTSRRLKPLTNSIVITSIPASS